MAKEDIGKIIDDETKRRLDIMSDPNYQFPDRFKKADVVAIIASITACGILILECMLGVIE